MAWAHGRTDQGHSRGVHRNCSLGFANGDRNAARNSRAETQDGRLTASIAVAIKSEPCQRKRRPVRGVKLRTVSTLTLLVALACLAAFIAGRPPVLAQYQGRTEPVSDAKTGASLRA